MKMLSALFAALLIPFLFAGAAHAQRSYSQAELDALLAPIALQTDGVVSQVLIAATYPDDVAAAARWARANPQMRGDVALRAVENEPWDPAVKGLAAFPELLIRMDESPQWMRELGEAFVQQQAQVMDTVQELRRRAQAAGHLTSTDQQAVSQEGGAIVVQPRTEIVYVPYYDPYVVYGAWWWPHYRPVYWRPWAVRPVFIHHGFWYAKPHWHHRHVQVVHKPVHVHHHHSQHVVTGKWQKHVGPKHIVTPHVRVPESQRQPIVQQHMPAAGGFTSQKREVRQHDAQQRDVRQRGGQQRSFDRDGGRRSVERDDGNRGFDRDSGRRGFDRDGGNRGGGNRGGGQGGGSRGRG
jgi:hypothetical protein